MNERPRRHAARAAALVPALGAVAVLAACGLQPWMAAPAACPEGPPPWRAAATPAPAAGGPRVRVVTWNIHAGMGLEHRLSTPRAEVEARLRRIAREIARAAPPGEPVDAVALNEVDFRSRRSGWVDQAAFLAAELEQLTGARYAVIRGVTRERKTPGLELAYGNALLTRHPTRASSVCLLVDGAACEGTPDADDLPRLRPDHLLGRALGEARGVIRVTLEHPSGPLDVVATHLEAVVQAARETQAAHLVRRFVDSERPTVLLGDMNAVTAGETRSRRYFRTDRTHDLLSAGALLDARVVVAARRGASGLDAWATFPADAPEWGLDHVFASPTLVPDEVEVLGTTESDHLGLLATFARADAGHVAAGRALQATLAQRRQAHAETCAVTLAARER